MNTHDKIYLPPHDATANIDGEVVTRLYSEAKVRAAIEADRQANNPESLTPAEAVFAFAAWLTSREQSVTFGATHGAAIAAELASEFTKSQGLQKFREDFHKHLIPYPSESAVARRQARGEPVTLEAERLAANRYRPVPDGVFAYKVVAGDGRRSLFSGSKDECYVVARKLTEAFLDGAFAATNAAPQPTESSRGEPVAWLCTPDFEGEQFLATTQGAADTLEKDGWSVQRLYDAPQPQQIPEGYKLVPQRLISLCEQFIRWRHCMSYNDSYFGESQGDLKRIAAEMERAMLEAVPEPK